MSDESHGRRRSNSERRNAALPSQDLARRLLALSEGQWKNLDLSESITDILEGYLRIKSHIARRRQERRLAAALHNEECDDIVSALDTLDGTGRDEAKIFQQVERVRKDIVAHEGAEEKFAETHALRSADKTELFALSKKARREREFGRPKGAGKALFRFLRRFL